MMTYLKVHQGDAQKEMDDIIGCHARFVFMKKLYINHLVAVVEANSDDA